MKPHFCCAIVLRTI